MRIGVPVEIKSGERRVGLVPSGVARLVADGHEVIVQRGAGHGAAFTDDAYRAAGASVAASAADAYACELVVKVKELQPDELPLIDARSTIFGFAQLARDPALLASVLRRAATIIGYETVTDDAGARPLLAPMSRIAGRLAPLVGARLLMQDQGGPGVLLAGDSSAKGARVAVVGAGSAGREAIAACLALGCELTVFARTRSAATALAAAYGDRAEVRIACRADLAEVLARTDLLIAAVLVPGRLSPTLIDVPMIASMPRGAVYIDIGIDQGGIAATARMTSIAAPVFVDHGVIHYAVPNMPALVPRSSTLALAQATLPYVVRLAAGIDCALREDPALHAGVQVRGGEIVHRGLAADWRHMKAVAPLDHAA